MSTFALDLQKFADKAGMLADQVVGECVADVASLIDERSPVGDGTYWISPPPKGYVGGHFRANWQLGADSIPSSVIDAVDPSGDVTLSAVKAEIPQQAAGKVYYLVNNVPYANRLEDGWSRQAPQGIVGRTAIEWQQIVDRRVAEVAR